MLHVSKDMDEEILYAPSPSSWSGSRSGSWSRWSSWSGCSSTLSRCYCPLATTALRSKSPTLRTWKRERRQFWEVSNIENTLENLQIFQTLLHWWSSLILRCLHVGKDMDDMKKYYMHCILCSARRPVLYIRDVGSTTCWNNLQDLWERSPRFVGIWARKKSPRFVGIISKICGNVGEKKNPQDLWARFSSLYPRKKIHKICGRDFHKIF